MTGAALDGMVVVDLTDALGAYASRLLADLGAEVWRFEVSDEMRTDGIPPLVSVSQGTVSAFDLFVNANKTIVDARTAAGSQQLRDILGRADAVIQSPGDVLDALGYTRDELRQSNPRLSITTVSAFGLEDDPTWIPVDDLIIMAAGGLLHLGGYPDLGPVVASGAQSRMAASIFAAVATLAAAIAQDRDDVGIDYEVSAQECIAQALEDSAATYALTGRVRERQGDQPREAGSGVYPCLDGYVSMIAGRLGTARAWSALVKWMNDEHSPGAEELLDDLWSTFEFRQSPEAIARFAEVFSDFTSSRGKDALYREAQARMIALSPVNTIEEVLANEQLHARGFFVPVEIQDHRVVPFPRAPYRMSATPPKNPRVVDRRVEDPPLFVSQEAG